MAFKNQKDHWAFLEEIEAPMWVDLTIEAKLNGQAIDDEWFQTSHLFHQSSSRELKSAFFLSGEDGIGASSSTFPQSVSRSRGKDYRSKKWKGNFHDVSLNKIQTMKVLNGKSSGLESGSSEGIKPKLSFIGLKGTSSSKTSSVSEITENVKGKNVKPVFLCEDAQRSSSPVADKSGETNSRSTVSTESIQQQQQQKFFEVSSRGFGQTSELLSSVRISLRKSCITRPASRVEIKADRRESRDHKSSSSKSSVGSSSYSGYDVKRSTIALIKRKEQTTDSRKISNMCNASNVRGKERNCNTGTEGLVTVAKPTWQEVAKSKLPHKVNEQKSLAGTTKAREKVGFGKINKVTGAGKENNIGEISLSQKCNGKGNAAGGMVVGRKGTSQTTSQKGVRTGPVVPKGRVGNQREGKTSTNSTRKLYFR
ncbi:uncharacterized protein LOC111302302 [Durio zibethinus]|uniref:Uncharacterized protein LOC111302302 n=1 Tax=Durio zibethinus TaxID=66656 RepID=A0A6P5ZNP9_DURZI|nr:uncharacterized protein LOC111302302 [Durio zibethinus]